MNKASYSLRMHKHIRNLGRIYLFKTGNKDKFSCNSFTKFMFQNFAKGDETCLIITNNEEGWEPFPGGS
jgi:hypothetical protein